MTFSYQLLAADNTELAAGAVKLKDMNFMHGSQLRRRNAPLNYEKNMLDSWFQDTFSLRIAANNE